MSPRLFYVLSPAEVFEPCRFGKANKDAAAAADPDADNDADDDDDDAAAATAAAAAACWPSVKFSGDSAMSRLKFGAASLLNNCCGADFNCATILSTSQPKRRKASNKA